MQQGQRPAKVGGAGVDGPAKACLKIVISGGHQVGSKREVFIAFQNKSNKRIKEIN